MEIGNQIRALRQRRGITQEALAQHLGVTAQAVSKWERNAATPDIGMLPDISAYFGVTIDELFALTDDTRMERIQNMLWDDRYYDPAEVESTREFLLNKGKKEPENGKVYEYLAEMENHLAQEHHEKAAEYAREALRRNPDLRGAHGELNEAMHGYIPDWNARNHYLQINFYKEHIQKNPRDWRAYMWLMDQLIDDYRLDEAEQYCDRFAQIDQSYRTPLYRGMIAWQRGERVLAFTIWGEMERNFPDEWCVWHNIGDYLARCGKYDSAMDYYRRALHVQKEPPMLDPLQAMAQLCEIRGDIPGALEARREEAHRIENQWHICGEELDIVLRDIARLERKL
jgi:transcriptional regulator with XRE-family HTH domain/Tfp pilus assembly protein PilF